MHYWKYSDGGGDDDDDDDDNTYNIGNQLDATIPVY